MKKKKVIHYIIAFILPVLLLFIIAMLSNHVPFGEYLFNYSDAYSMYPAILTHSIRTILDGNFFYNIYSALGSDFYNLRTLYMNSPFHLLFFLFKKENIFVFYTILLFLKVGLSSYTMCIYLNHISKDKYTWKQILFSLTYALSSFGVACSVHIMWTDSVILLPLIILGLDKLIEENKSGFYILYLTLAILVNFYIGYMLCIFCLIYFLYKAYVREKLQVETCKHFIFSSLLCGMMSSIVLIPQIISLIAGRGSHFSFSTLKGISIFSLFSIPSSLLSGMYSSFDNFSNGSPLLYCSLFVLVMNIFYFFNKKISKREKKATFFVILLFFCSLFIHIIDYSWNMFQEPVWYAHRYVFVIVFFLIIIGFKSFMFIQDVKISSKSSSLILILFSMLSFVSFLYKAKSFGVEKNYIIGLLLSFFVFGVYFCLFQNKKYRYFIFVCLFMELVYNGYVILSENSVNTYDISQKYVSLDCYFKNLKEEDTTFYRTLFPRANANDSMYFDFYSGELFSSSYDKQTKDFLSNKINFVNSMELNQMRMRYYNPALLSLFGFKYVVGNSTYYNKIQEGIYLNAQVLPIGFVVPEVKEYTYYDGEYYTNIEKMYASFLHDEVQLFEDIEVENYHINSSVDDFLGNMDEVSYSFTVDKSGILVPKNDLLYFTVTSVSVNGEDVKTLDYYSNQIIANYVDNIIRVKKGDQVKVTITLNEKEKNIYDVSMDDKEQFLMVLLNENNFIEVIDKLQQMPSFFDVDTKNSVLSGKVISDGGTLFFSIPYLDTFHVRVDGKEVAYNKVVGTFIGIEVEAGEHDIVINYLPKGFKIGGLVSLIGIFLTGVYLFRRKIIDKS